MHEMSIAAAIVEEATRIAGEHGVSRIEELEVQIGVIRQVVPEALEMAFAFASEGTPVEGAQLHVTEEQLVAVCNDCDCMFLPAIDNFLCPKCGRANARIVAGNHIVLQTVVFQSAEEVSAA